MKLSSALLTLLLSSLVASQKLSFFAGQTVLDNNDLSVPGDNPLTFCVDTTEGDILAIDHVDLKPNPPVPGQTLTIEATGTLSEMVEEGAYVNLEVKYGLIRIINQKTDLCDALGNVDRECPVDEGELVFTKDLDIPNQIPPGKYTVLADVFTKDKKKITCLQASVVFGS